MRCLVRATRPILPVAFIVLVLIVLSMRSPNASAQGQAPFADGGKDITTAVAEETFFEGFGTDSDGFIEEYEWDFDGDGTYEFSSITTGDASWTYQATGIYNAVFRVTDNDNQQDTDTVKVTVVEGNDPPTADAGPDLKVHAMDLVTFAGTGKDPDGHIIKYEWDFDGDKKFDWSSSKNGTAQWMYTVLNTYYATFKVTDDGALPANATDVIKVVVYAANRPPVAKAGTDFTVHAKQVFRVYGKGTDVDGRITKYEWDFDSNGGIDRESPTTGEAIWSYDTPGTYTATLRVTDNAELPSTGTDSIRITVLDENKPPTATCPETSATAYVDTVVVLSCSGTDVDGIIVEYRWDFNGDNTYEWSSSKNGSTFFVYTRPGTYSARFMVIDDVGATANATKTVTINAKKAPPEPPLIEMNLGFFLALLIGLGVGVGIGIGATYGYLHISIASKYRKVKELETHPGAEEDATFRGVQAGEREPPTFRGGEGL